MKLIILYFILYIATLYTLAIFSHNKELILWENNSLFQKIKVVMLSLVLIINVKYPIKMILIYTDLYEYYFLFCGIYSCFFILLIRLFDDKTIPNIIGFISIFTLAASMCSFSIYIFSNHDIQELISLFSLLTPLVLYADANEASSGTTGTTSNTSGNSTEADSKTTSKENKSSKPKPDLTIKVKPESGIEKDNFKIGVCTHDKLSLLKMNTESEVDNTYCDFSSDSKTENHKALDGVSDNAFLCDNCHGIFCKNCVQEYSDESE